MGLLTVLHIFVAVILIFLVLVQDSKGAMGSTFGGGGGGGNTLFGATGADNALTKLTKGFVVLFALTCILLTRLSAQNRDSVLDEVGAGTNTPTEAVESTDVETTNTQTDTPTTLGITPTT